jgi:hypothetical protein
MSYTVCLMFRIREQPRLGQLTHGDFAEPYQSNPSAPPKFPVTVAVYVVRLAMTVVIVLPLLVIVFVSDPTPIVLSTVRVGGSVV